MSECQSNFNKIRILWQRFIEKNSPWIPLSNLIILFLTFLVLSFNLLAFWDQNRLSENINQPLCGIKSAKVIPVKNIVLVSFTIKNFGKYVSRDISVVRKFYTVEDYFGRHVTNKINLNRPSLEKPLADVTLFPEQEIQQQIQFSKKDFESFVIDDKVCDMVLDLNFKMMHGERKTYSCTYTISRFSGGLEEYDVALTRSQWK